MRMMLIFLVILICHRFTAYALYTPILVAPTPPYFITCFGLLNAPLSLFRRYLPDGDARVVAVLLLRLRVI